MLTLTCTSYPEGGTIPLRHAHRSVRGGGNVSPGFTWPAPPGTTATLLLVIVDPHPVAGNWVHWLVTGLPAGCTGIPEGVSGTTALPAGARERVNSFGEQGYGGPAPPPGSGKHPYVAHLMALSAEPVLPHGKIGWKDVLRASEKVLLERAEATGYFERR